MTEFREGNLLKENANYESTPNQKDWEPKEVYQLYHTRCKDVESRDKHFRTRFISYPFRNPQARELGGYAFR